MSNHHAEIFGQPTRQDDMRKYTQLSASDAEDLLLSDDRTTTFDQLIFDGICVPDANLRGKMFTNCIFAKCAFTDVEAVNARFTNCRFIQTNMQNGNFTDTGFKGGGIVYCNFRHAKLYRADFDETTIEGSDFRKADFRDSTFTCKVLKSRPSDTLSLREHLRITAFCRNDL